MSKLKKPRLGRGLSSLMSSPVAIDQESAPQADSPGAPHGVDATPQQTNDSTLPAVVFVAVDLIAPNPYQPRRRFDEASIEQLAQSIRQDGVMQPVIVRPSRSGHGYELVAGERRWRAAQRAGILSIPSLVRELDDRQIAEWAVIENLQREDLDPIERAHAFAKLATHFNLTHHEIAERVGIDRTSVTNLIRLLELPQEVQELVRCGQLSMGHVRSLLGIAGSELQSQVARRAISSGWTVRRIEQVVRQMNESAAPRAKQAGRSAHLADIERQMAMQLQTKVRIKPARRKNAGTLMIEYYDLDQFDSLLSKLGVSLE